MLHFKSLRVSENLFYCLKSPKVAQLSTSLLVTSIQLNCPCWILWFPDLLSTLLHNLSHLLIYQKSKSNILSMSLAWLSGLVYFGMRDWLQTLASLTVRNGFKHVSSAGYHCSLYQKYSEQPEASIREWIKILEVYVNCSLVTLPVGCIYRSVFVYICDFLNICIFTP